MKTTNNNNSKNTSNYAYRTLQTVNKRNTPHTCFDQLGNRTKIDNRQKDIYNTTKEKYSFDGLIHNFNENAKPYKRIGGVPSGIGWVL